MARNYAELAFTEKVKEMQEKMGSRKNYSRLENESYVNGLTENEIEFISQRDSFYMASIGSNGYPYVQHRGGPKGFVKVLDANRIGFIDFRGNMQYISVGNLATDHHVSLIMVDYPGRARLKILAIAEIVSLKDNADLFSLLDLNDYSFLPERMIILNVEAYDWNCPQHITPRYTLEDIDQIVSIQRDQILKLESEIKTLKAR